MSAFCFIAFGRNVRAYKPQIVALCNYLSFDSGLKVSLIEEKYLIMGAVSNDGRARCITFKDRGLSILFNGQIYLIEGRRIGDAGSSLTLCYENKGVLSSDDVEGHYIAAIYNHREKSLFISNDAFGLQPLYYHEKDGAIFFCSEAEAFIKCGLVKPMLDVNALAQCFVLGCIIGSNTLINDIARMRPNTELEANLDKRVFRRGSYKFRTGFKIISLKDAYELLDRYIDESIMNAVRSFGDDEVVLRLSGGLDSRLILNFLIENKVRFKAITYDNPFREEQEDLKYASMLSEKFGFPHEIVAEKPGEQTKYHYLLNARVATYGSRIGGQFSCLIKGKLGKVVSLKGDFESRDLLRRIFTDEFIKGLSEDPVETARSEIERTCCPPHFRDKLFHMENLSSFFTNQTPAFHRRAHYFLKDAHYPLLSRDIFETIALTPEYRENSSYDEYLRIKHRGLLDVPSTTWSRHMSGRGKYDLNNPNVDEKQLDAYYRYLLCVSPLWEENIFNYDFAKGKQRISALLFNIWYDHYFGNDDAVLSLKAIENNLTIKNPKRKEM